MTFDLIASPYPDGYVVVRRGSDGGIKIGRNKYVELCDAMTDASVPDWLATAALSQWELDVADHAVADTVLVRPDTEYGYARASYELNLGCNYDCEHCYLGEKLFAGMGWDDRERLLDIMQAAGVLWLQLTGGEPLIDPLFAETHTYAWESGMMIQISSNGSRLDNPKILELLTTKRPYRLTLSIYGATDESYDGMTRRRGSFKRFMRGLAAAHEAGLNIRINCVLSNRNAHERDAMTAIADRYGIPSFEYTNITPTMHGTGEVLPSQAREVMRRHEPYTGCNAGITHFHADPHGKASICKIGREDQIDLMAEGVEGLRRLAVIGGQAHHPPRRVLRLRSPEDVRHVYADGQSSIDKPTLPWKPTASTAVDRCLPVGEGVNNDRRCRRDPPGPARARHARSGRRGTRCRHRPPHGDVLV